MNMMLLVAALLLGVIGFAMMMVAFTFVILRGGWKTAMAVQGHGRWPLPRMLMLIGASLGVMFSAAMTMYIYLGI